jgi:hypothetical protein
MFAKDRTLATARNRGNRTRARSSPRSAPPGSFGYDYNVGPSVSPASLVRSIALPGGNSITNELDSVGRLTSTRLLNPQLSTINQHLYIYDLAGERTKQTRTDGSYVDYGYDQMGQLLTAKGKESGGTTRWHEQFGYAYDAAGNLNWRTNNDLKQRFQVNTLNELTNVSRPGSVMTVAGTTPAPQRMSRSTPSRRFYMPIIRLPAPTSPSPTARTTSPPSRWTVTGERTPTP